VKNGGQGRETIRGGGVKEEEATEIINISSWKKEESEMSASAVVRKVTLLRMSPTKHWEGNMATTMDVTIEEFPIEKEWDVEATICMEDEVCFVEADGEYPSLGSINL
jgi:hypothetical protein